MIRDQIEVSLLAQGVILIEIATPIRLITRWPSLFLSSFTLTPIGLPYGSLSRIGLYQMGGVRAYLVLREYLNGLGLASSPVVRRLWQMTP